MQHYTKLHTCINVMLATLLLTACSSSNHKTTTSPKTEVENSKNPKTTPILDIASTKLSTFPIYNKLGIITKQNLSLEKNNQGQDLLVADQNILINAFDYTLANNRTYYISDKIDLEVTTAMLNDKQILGIATSYNQANEVNQEFNDTIQLYGIVNGKEQALPIYVQTKYDAVDLSNKTIDELRKDKIYTTLHIAQDTELLQDNPLLNNIKLNSNPEQKAGCEIIKSQTYSLDNQAGTFIYQFQDSDRQAGIDKQDLLKKFNNTTDKNLVHYTLLGGVKALDIMKNGQATEHYVQLQNLEIYSAKKFNHHQSVNMPKECVRYNEIASQTIEKTLQDFKK